MAVQVDGKPVRMSLEHANRKAEAVLEEPLDATSNYFIGQDEKNWRTGIPHYARVRYKDVYPGIDLMYYANGRELEYDFRLQPNADPSAIRLAFNQPVRTDENGDLLIGGMRQKRPKILQNGRDIACDYLVRDAHHVQLALAQYDRSQSLTVDPTLVFSTYLGGPGRDSTNGIALDASGNLYIAMSTQSPAAPILNPFQQENVAVLQPAIFKFTPDGQHLIFYSILITGAWDGTEGIAVDSSNSPIVIGTTESANLPLKNPVQSTFDATYWNGFITKLTPDGRSLVYSTYFGGSNQDTPNSVAVDAQGNAYIAGQTDSRDIPVKNAIQPNLAGSYDGFLAKLSPAGALLFSTYYGGSDRDFFAGVTIAPDGSLVVGGESFSTDFPLKNPIQTELTIRLGYLTPVLVKFSADGQTVNLATYVAGPVAGGIVRPAVDAAGNVYIVGSLVDDNLTVKNAYQSTLPANPSAFLVKYDASMNLIYGTYLGGSGGAGAIGVAVDSSGSAYVLGDASSADFPQKNSLQPFVGGGYMNYDIFVTKFDPSGSSLIYSTLIGGSNSDQGGWNGIVLDASNNAYVIGNTFSSDFTVKNAFQPTFGGGGDGVLFEISDNTPVSPSPLTLTPGRLVFQYTQGGTAPTAQTVNVAGPAFTSNASDGWIVATAKGSTLSVSVNTTALAPGTYNGSVTLSPAAGTPATLDIALTVLAPAPVIASITPSLIGEGSNDTPITITGSGFTTQSVLFAYGEAWTTSPVTFVNSTTLTLTLPKSDLLGDFIIPFSVQNPQSAVSNVVAVTVGPPGPQYSAAGVVNAASFAPGPVAPGEIVTIFGTNLAQNVYFDNIPATLVYFSPTQVNVTVPYQVAGEATTQLIVGDIGSVVPVPVNVAPAAPGIFAAVPAGDNIVTLYSTGCGTVSNDPLPRCVLPVTVTVNSQPGQVLYAGIAPSLIQGANQINFQLPPGVTSGALSVVLSVNGINSAPFNFMLP
jgi:uncharacterized protein (TIGR03437 family)